MLRKWWIRVSDERGDGEELEIKSKKMMGMLQSLRNEEMVIFVRFEDL